MADFPILTTERLILREFRPDDAPAVFAIFSREVVTRYHNLERMQSPAEAQALVERRLALWTDGIGARWAIALGAQPAASIGSCGYYNANAVSRSIEIGFELHPGHWRRGIMSEALNAMIDHCFSDGFAFPLNRIEALIDVAHIASLGLLSKLGFQEEGIRREYAYWKSRFHDLRAFSLLRRDWEYNQRLKNERDAQPSAARRDASEKLPGDGGPAAGQQQSRLRGWIV